MVPLRGASTKEEDSHTGRLLERDDVGTSEEDYTLGPRWTRDGRLVTLKTQR